jgi:hypothetical protein
VSVEKVAAVEQPKPSAQFATAKMFAHTGLPSMNCRALVRNLHVFIVNRRYASIKTYSRQAQNVCH